MADIKNNKKDKDSADEKFESLLTRLQGIVRSLEGGDCSLEDSIKKFEEGMALAKSCQERLTKVEQRIEVLMKADADGVETKPFETE